MTNWAAASVASTRPVRVPDFVDAFSTLTRYRCVSVPAGHSELSPLDDLAPSAAIEPLPLPGRSGIKAPDETSVSVLVRPSYLDHVIRSCSRNPDARSSRL
jgi:hypothetical protein